MIHILYAAYILHTYYNSLTSSVSSDMLITSCSPQQWHYVLQQLLHRQLHPAHADLMPRPLQTRLVPSGSLLRPSGISCVPKEIVKEITMLFLYKLGTKCLNKTQISELKNVAN